MDIFSRMKDLNEETSADESEAGSTQIRFDQFSIFQKGDKDTDQDVEDVRESDTVDKPDLSVLGMDSSVLDGIMSRLNGKKGNTAASQTVTQVDAEVGSESTTPTADLPATQLLNQSVTQSATQPVIHPITTFVESTQKISSIRVGTSLQPTQPIVGKTQSVQKTQSIQRTQPVQKTQIVATEVIPTIETTGTQIIDSDDDDDVIIPQRRQLGHAIDATIDLGESQESDVNEDTIENYKDMTREEKVRARVERKERERRERREREEAEMEAKLQEEEREEPVLPKIVPHLKSAKLQQLAEAVKQNELIRKSTFVIRKTEKSKFTPSKLIENFDMDSDSEDERLFSAKDGNQTPHSSPKAAEELEKSVDRPMLSIPLGNYEQKLREEAGSREMISLDSDNDSTGDEDDLLEAKADKQKVFEVKRKISAKKKGLKPRKKTIKDLIKEETTKQMRKIARERQSQFPESDSGVSKEANVPDEREINKMLEEEIARSKKLAEIEKEKEERSKWILEGNDEELDESEEENESEDNESEEDESEEKSGSEDEGKEDDDKVHVESSIPDTQITFQLTSGSTKAFKGLNMSLGDVFDQSEPVDKSFEGLQGVDVVRKLQNINSRTPETSFQEGWGENNTNGDTFNDGSFLQSVTEEPVEENKLDPRTVDERKRLLASQNFLPDTQVDEGEDSEEAPGDTLVDSEDDEDDEKVKVTANRRLRSTKLDSITEVAENASSGSDEEVYEDEETRKLRLFKIQEAKRRDRERRKALRKEFKEAGMAEVLENEAVESDDEWHGIGGEDGEGSDRENSEDEKLLDDSSKIEVDEDKIRANLAQHNVEADDELVKKIYRDLKSGAFRKRRAHDGAYELDLSDDEDDYMREFYERRRKEYLEQQYLKDAGLRELAKNQSSRAFYETIAGDAAKMSRKSVEFEEEVNGEEREDDNPFGRDQSKRSSSKSEEDEDDEDEVIVHPKRRRLTAEQVHSMISFLEEEDQPEVPDIDGLDSDDGVDEIKYIKAQSKVKLRQLVAPKKKGDSSNTQNVIDLEDDQKAPDDTDGGFGLLATRSRSVTASFRHSETHRTRYSTTTGHEVHEVTVTVGSRPSLSSKGSVTSMTSRDSYLKNDFQLKSSKAARIEEILRSDGGGLRKIYKSISGFEES
ncbi:DEKNAAC104067 [Brettanomyces naardenensis]|uniref:DEKNAAC104067 n=1 Tax=Brettanomyces naardenensis TaxID=13370 RepID=A0A448YQ76_BRENA|nr:DEKNAAC104067 [Brettanomyces naardenensis]